MLYIAFMAVKNHLKWLRIQKGDRTQQDVADAVGCSRQTIHSIESGKFVPSVELAMKIARLLETPVEQVFELETKESKK